MSRATKRIAILLAVGVFASRGRGARTTEATDGCAPWRSSPTNGHLLCLVRADSAQRIDVLSRIVGPQGTEGMVECGSTFVVSPIGTEDGRYHVEQDAGTTTDERCFCEVSVSGARRNDLKIGVTLESRDATGALLQMTHVRLTNGAEPWHRSGLLPSIGDLSPPPHPGARRADSCPMSGSAHASSSPAGPVASG